MNRMIICLLILFATKTIAQGKNFIDRPYLETTAKADTLVVPDRLFLSIVINEADTKDKVSVEKMEKRMEDALVKLGIDTKEQLFLSDFTTNFKDYFLRKTGVVKAKEYSLLVYDAVTAGKVIQRLESERIANVNFEKAELSNIEEIKLELRKNAVKQGLLQAAALLEPLGKSAIEVLYLSDINTGVIYPWQRGNLRMEAMTMSDQNQPIDIDFQKIKVESTVSLRVAID